MVGLGMHALLVVCSFHLKGDARLLTLGIKFEILHLFAPFAVNLSRFILGSAQEVFLILFPMVVFNTELTYLLLKLNQVFLKSSTLMLPFTLQISASLLRVRAFSVVSRKHFVV